ncbi:MAG TPA: response regulator [Methylophilaceae bacterium]|nr:response regulator [Methylophilaceae bacterium]
MSTKDEAFLKKLRATFKIEAEEHLQAIAAGLLQLEKKPESEAPFNVIETIFRAAHSLKGAARAVDFKDIEALCQSLENVFEAWKRQQGIPNTSAFDVLYQAVDEATSMLAGASSDNRAMNLGLLSDSLDRLVSSELPALDVPEEIVAEPVAAAVPVYTAAADGAGQSETKKNGGCETVRIPVSKLEAQLLESEEMLTAKLTADQRAADLRELAHSFQIWRSEWTAIEPEVQGLRQSREKVRAQGERRSSSGIMRLLDFIDWSVDYIASVENRAANLGRKAQQDSYVIGKMVDDLLEDSKQLLLLPFSTVSASFHKLVRDICREQGKRAKLIIIGEDTELDKLILEEMKDPFIHLLRNSIDHGIESPEERIRLGKPLQASITLTVSQINANKVQLLVSDDGAGIDTEKVKESAIKHGLISREDVAQLNEDQAQALIFQSSVSTSPIITQLSGRGLGLAIVREKAEKLGGQVTVESQVAQGTTFRILLPATRATFRGILVEVAGQRIILPTTQVERVVRTKSEDIQTVEGRETIVLEGRTTALVQMAQTLELSEQDVQEMPAIGAPVVVLGSGDQRVAFTVDAVLDELEVLVKPLPKPLSRVRNIAAATVLGSGQVVPIVNVSDLLKSARKVTGSVNTVAITELVEAEGRKILIAEDSITSRMLLKTILESAGYQVKTAVDGIEAFSLLRAEKFNLLVSDVEMPRLNGFDLTAKIRADKKLQELPVVLVTALESREDKERGIDVGANAYLVKSNFDQSNLLQAVQQLI